MIVALFLLNTDPNLLIATVTVVIVSMVVQAVLKYGLFLRVQRVVIVWYCLKEIIIYGRFFFKQEEILGVHGILSKWKSEVLGYVKVEHTILPP
jgi:hypothetical protein